MSPEKYFWIIFSTWALSLKKPSNYVYDYFCCRYDRETIFFFFSLSVFVPNLVLSIAFFPFSVKNYELNLNFFLIDRTWIHTIDRPLNWMFTAKNSRNAATGWLNMRAVNWPRLEGHDIVVQHNVYISTYRFFF